MKNRGCLSIAFRFIGLLLFWPFLLIGWMWKQGGILRLLAPVFLLGFLTLGGLFQTLEPLQAPTGMLTPIQNSMAVNTTSPTSTATAASMPTQSPMSTTTATLTQTPTETSVPTQTPTATNTATPLPTATNTATPLPTATNTATPLPTVTPTPAIVDVHQILGKPEAEVNAILGIGHDPLLFEAGDMSSYCYSGSGKTQDYYKENYMLAAYFDQADILRCLQIIAGLREEKYSLQDWPSVLRLLGLPTSKQPDITASAALVWENIDANYSVRVWADSSGPTAVIWSVLVALRE